MRLGCQNTSFWASTRRYVAFVHHPGGLPLKMLRQPGWRRAIQRPLNAGNSERGMARTPIFPEVSERTPRCGLNRCNNAWTIVEFVPGFQKPGQLTWELSECVESGVDLPRGETHWHMDGLSFHTGKHHHRPDAKEIQSTGAHRRNAMMSGLRSYHKFDNHSRLRHSA